MKKNIGLLIAGVLLLGIGLYGATAIRVPERDSQQRSITEHSVVPGIPQVTLVLDTSEDVLTYSGIRAENAYDALVRVAESEALTLETKQYDFGVFVESIAGHVNTQELVWIYFVNGEAGGVAADAFTLQDGDTVEWRYTQPIY